MRRGDVSGNVRPMMLPDKRLPELDDALVGALHQGKPLEPLIACVA